MTAPAVDLPTLQSINASAPSNRWAGLEVTAVEPGRVELRVPWREEFGQDVGAVHAGVVAALVDTACGFAAATAVGSEVTASQCSVDHLAPARGAASVVRAEVVEAGRRQVFTRAEVFAGAGEEATLVATGQTILVPLG